LWQTLILMQKYPFFEFLPVESLIKENQEAYYSVLEQSDNIGQSTPFIEWMLNIILQALENLLKTQNRTLTAEDRIELFKDKIRQQQFSRKDYLQNFKEISQATASRDLRWAVEQEILEKSGDKRLTKYRFK
ncbi:MAG: Fic family protein, partial [Saprospiraceae bacterium]|nr:Fic family protein [Saprospiraceae bacterium]